MSRLPQPCLAQHCFGYGFLGLCFCSASLVLLRSLLKCGNLLRWPFSFLLLVCILSVLLERAYVSLSLSFSLCVSLYLSIYVCVYIYISLPSACKVFFVHSLLVHCSIDL